MILGLESSCDESALSLLEEDGTIIGEWVHSQVAQHAEYGGVVPDLAVPGQHLRRATGARTKRSLLPKKQTLIVPVR